MWDWETEKLLDPLSDDTKLPARGSLKGSHEGSRRLSALRAT